jgi:molecular chaperone HtpG
MQRGSLTWLRAGVQRREFQAETKKLLEIVASSLYSDREVFIRELVSNASDALEKLRYRVARNEPVQNAEAELEIRISTDESGKRFIIEASACQTF